MAGLEGVLDLLAPEDAEAWLSDSIKMAVLSFQSFYEAQAALVFWLPLGHSRMTITSVNEEVNWLCEAQYRGRHLDFGRIIWGRANEYPREILLSKDGKPVGLFHLRIT